MGIGIFVRLLVLQLMLTVYRMSRMQILTMGRRRRMIVRKVVLMVVPVVEGIDPESIGLEGTDLVLGEDIDLVCFHHSLLPLRVICRLRVVLWLRM